MSIQKCTCVGKLNTPFYALAYPEPKGMKSSFCKNGAMTMDLDEAAKEFRTFVAVIKRLRTPGTGCPWDLEQNHKTLRPFLIEEAYEVLDAIDRADDRALREELGDLLLQVILHAQVADDRGAFSITEVIHDIERKMVRRHPHVFGSAEARDSEQVIKNWDQIKAAENAEKGYDPAPAASLKRLPESMPALQCAHRLGEKAAKMGLEQKSLAFLTGKVSEGLKHLTKKVHEVQKHSEPLEHELGEVLFGICQIARLLGLHAEDSLRASNRRFIENFPHS